MKRFIFILALVAWTIFQAGCDRQDTATVGGRSPLVVGPQATPSIYWTDVDFSWEWTSGCGGDSLITARWTVHSDLGIVPYPTAAAYYASEPCAYSGARVWYDQGYTDLGADYYEWVWVAQDWPGAKDAGGECIRMILYYDEPGQGFQAYSTDWDGLQGPYITTPDDYAPYQQVQYAVLRFKADFWEAPGGAEVDGYVRWGETTCNAGATQVPATYDGEYWTATIYHGWVDEIQWRGKIQRRTGSVVCETLLGACVTLNINGDPGCENPPCPDPEGVSPQAKWQDGAGPSFYDGPAIGHRLYELHDLYRFLDLYRVSDDSAPDLGDPEVKVGDPFGDGLYIKSRPKKKPQKKGKHGYPGGGDGAGGGGGGAG